MHSGTVLCVDCVKKWEKWAHNYPKKSFFELYKNFSRSSNLLDWSEMNILIICYVTVELPNVGKIWSLRYGLKYFWPINLRDSSKCKISRKKWGIKLHGFCSPPIVLGDTTLKFLKYFTGRKQFWKYGRGTKLDGEKKKNLKKKTLWPLFMNGVQLPEG